MIMKKEMRIIERNFSWEVDMDCLLSKEGRKKLSNFLTPDAVLLLNLIYSLFVKENELRGSKYSEHMLLRFSVDDVEKKTKLSGQRQRKAIEILERCELIKYFYSYGNKRTVVFLFNNVSEFYTVFSEYQKSLKCPYQYYQQLKQAFIIDEEEEE